jgi:hypothetical protein
MVGPAASKAGGCSLAAVPYPSQHGRRWRAFQAKRGRLGMVRCSKCRPWLA